MLKPEIKAGYPWNKDDTRSITPGVSILEIKVSAAGLISLYFFLRMALEILHDVQKAIVHVGSVSKAGFDLVQVL